MRSLRLADLQRLISQPDFQGWWIQFRAANEALASARAHHRLLVEGAATAGFRSELAQRAAIETLDMAREREDAAAALHSEATDAENAAFQLVSQYEDLRIHVSELWYRLGALEKSLEERRADAARQGAGKKAEEGLRAATRAHQARQEEYERLGARKQDLWERVEATWALQAETSLRVAEQRMRGKRLRSEAEGQLEVTERLKGEAERARAEADRASGQISALRVQVSRHLADAALRFGCAAGEDFLYFRQRDQAGWSFCVALVENGDSYNLEVRPLAVYSVEQKRGVTFLEPARERAATAQEGDQRFEQYFLSGRKGRAPASGA